MRDRLTARVNPTCSLRDTGAGGGADSVCLLCAQAQGRAEKTRSEENACSYRRSGGRASCKHRPAKAYERLASSAQAQTHKVGTGCRLWVALAWEVIHLLLWQNFNFSILVMKRTFKIFRVNSYVSNIDPRLFCLQVK